MKTFAETLIAIDAFWQMNASFAAPEHLRDTLLAWLDEHDSRGATQIRRTLENFFAGIPLEIETFSLDPAEKAFARHIASLQPYVMFLGNPPPAFSNYLTTDSSDDFLADNSGLWGVFRIVNLLLMSSIRPNKQIAIVTSIRDEGISLLEWVAHYRGLGVHDFFVYTNDNADGSDVVLDLLANSRVINLIRNTVVTARSIQAKVMEHSIHILNALREYEWVFYIDVDEFFIPRIGNRSTLNNVIQKLGSTFDRNAPSSISFHWKWFGSENKFERSEGLLLERFLHSIHNEHVKSLVRLRDVVSMQRVHVPVLVPSAWGVTSDLQPFDLSGVGVKAVHGIGQLNHYWNKSFQEFAIKRSRGRISGSKHGEALDFSTFFLWGSNGRRGNFDPPPAEIISRTKQMLMELLAIAGMRESVACVEDLFQARVAELDSDLSLRRIYDDQISSVLAT